MYRNTAQDLKPCPFCGSYNVQPIEALLESDKNVHTYSVCCITCKIGIFRPNFTDGEYTAYRTKSEAIKEWNRRGRR